MLFDSYKLNFWYFELMEMARKFIMTSVVIFLYPGSPHQAAGGLFVTSLFLIFFIAAHPFTSAVINKVQGVSLAAQAATLFYGLMLTVEKQSAVAGESERQFLVYFVLLLNILVFLLPVFAVLLDPGKRRQIFQYLQHLAAVARLRLPARERPGLPAQAVGVP